jgi:hypothetical protein
MSPLLNDPEHWRERAKAMRELSAEMLDPESRNLMLKIADDYEVLAQRAEARVVHRPRETELGGSSAAKKEPDHL